MYYSHASIKVFSARLNTFLELQILVYLQVIQRGLFDEDIKAYYIQVYVQLQPKLSLYQRTQCLYIKHGTMNKVGDFCFAFLYIMYISVVELVT